ncbi:MAG: glycosyltransferase family 4 protein [Planctomycetota bacterium]|nr:glycosyltransferase family 4 protein [Planctomycetota bacterium]
MRILHLAAGAADLYCGACQRDAALRKALIALGHEVEIVALYTPLRVDEDLALPPGPILYGGLNVYLQQISRLFRWLPMWADRLFAAPALLRFLSSFAIETRPPRLGALTVSMLSGHEGRQSKELDRLIAYLSGRPRPDVISLSNSLLSGVAPALKKVLNTPLVCSVQGEDLFVDALSEPFRTQSRHLLRCNAKHIDFFVAPSHYHADRMVELLAIPAEKMAVVRTGVAVDKFRRLQHPIVPPLRVGYLAAITPAKGLDLLVEAIAPLAERHPGALELHIAGKILNQKYWHHIHHRLQQMRLHISARYAGELSGTAKTAFLQNLNAFAAPSRLPEPRALAAIEALAAGAPIVAPNFGVFPEIISLTGGGLLYTPGEAADLRRILQHLLSDDMVRQLSHNASDGARRHFALERMAEEFADLCARQCAKGKAQLR